MGSLGRAFIRMKTSYPMESMSNDEWFFTLLELVKENKQIAKVKKLKKEAKLPHPMAEITDTNIRLQPCITNAEVSQLLSFEWVKKCQHLLIYGEAGEGKNHLASSFGNSALERLYKVQCFDFNQLVFDIRLAKQKQELYVLCESIRKVDVVTVK